MLTNATLINKNAKPKSSYSSNARHLKVWASFTNVTTSEYFRQIHLFFFLLVSFSLKIKSLNILFKGLGEFHKCDDFGIFSSNSSFFLFTRFVLLKDQIFEYFIAMMKP